VFSIRRAIFMPRRSLQILTLANVEPMLAATAPFEQKTRGGVNATAWLSLARLRAFDAA